MAPHLPGLHHLPKTEHAASEEQPVWIHAIEDLGGAHHNRGSEDNVQPLCGKLVTMMHLIEAKKVKIGGVITSMGKGLRAPAPRQVKEQFKRLLGTLQRAASKPRRRGNSKRP